MYMDFQEITFRIRYDSPYVKMSEKYPGSRISMWCVWDRELLHVSGKGLEIGEDIQKDVDRYGLMIESARETPNGSIMMMKCTCDVFSSVWNLTGRYRLVDLLPAIFVDGWGYYKVLSFEDEKLRDFFAELNSLGKVELVSKRNVDFAALPSNVWVGALFNDLTGKQMDSILKAYEYGYYDSPREITTESVAKSLGISRSTYEEHLRKAENKIMDAVMPYLKLFRSGNPPQSKVIIPEISITE